MTVVGGGVRLGCAWVVLGLCLGCAWVAAEILGLASGSAQDDELSGVGYSPLQMGQRGKELKQWRMSIGDNVRLPNFLITQVLLSLVLLPVGASTSTFSITLQTSGKAFQIGEPVVLRATITNVSDHEIKFARGFGEQEFDFEIEVEDAKGNTPPITEAYRKLKDPSTPRSGSYSTYSLEPGKSFDDELDVTKLYDMRRPGKYTVSVTRGQLPLWETSGKDGVKSNAVTITLEVPKPE
jgi:hypothetical protein